jgi:hypothetical protein
VEARQPKAGRCAAGSLSATLLVLAALAAGGGGCAARTQARANHAESATLATEEISQRVESLADRFIGSEAHAYESLEAGSSDEKVRAWARTTKIGQALAAMAIATGPNPYENAVDLVVMISLKRAEIEANEARTLLSPQEAAPLIESYKRDEAMAWDLVRHSLAPAHEQELRETIAQFLRENPDLRNAGFVRFTDLARLYLAQATKHSPGGNLLSLLFLDPLAGLDPATRELRQTRLLLERTAYVLQRLPLIVQWQAHQAGADLLDLPQSQRVVQATTRFAAATDRFADAAAGYPQALKTEREAAIAQLQQAVDVQRKAVVIDFDAQRKATFADLDVQRKAAFADVDAQRKAAFADLDGQQSKLRDLLADARSSIDRAEKAGVQVNAATARTIDTAQTAANHTLWLAFWLSLALLACLLVGIPLSGLLYRHLRRSDHDRSLAHT